MLKRCNKCEEFKPRYEFSKRAMTKGDGLQNRCKSCAAAYHANRLSLGIKNKRAKVSVEASKRYRIKNAEKIAEYQRAYQARKKKPEIKPDDNDYHYNKVETKQNKEDRLYRSVIFGMPSIPVSGS